MVKYSENGREWVKIHLNENMKPLYKHKGCCRFSSRGKHQSNNIYRVIQSPIGMDGELKARIEVEDIPPSMDDT